MLAQETYTNPVFNHNFPDPFIYQDGKTFYAYATHQNGEGFQILSSPDLVHWKRLPAVGKPSWSHNQMWAPEVHKWKGKYYFFYSALNPTTNKRDLGVQVGDSPTGPFKEISILITGVSENEGSSQDGAIDPTLHIEKGKPYLLYIKEAAPRALKIVELSADLSQTIGERKVLIRPDKPAEHGILDAPTLVKRGRTYWLMYSGGWFQSSKKDACYTVLAAKSDSLFGPYTKRDLPVLATKENEVLSPGHQCVFQVSDEWWMAYHGWDNEGEPMYGHNKNGRSLRIDRLRWTKEGPICDGPTSTPQLVPDIK